MVRVLVSSTISSSFVCGLLKPTILVPGKLVEDLPADQLSALLAHEIAHLRGHDVLWCVTWRWVQATFWFHPLLWKIPAAHSLACEQEADRLAAGHSENRGFYSQSLARLALRVLDLPETETRLAVNGASQIAQRLHHLQRVNGEFWNSRKSAAALGLVGILFLLATGCKAAKTAPAAANTPAALEFKTVLAVVQDQDGKPIEGASITPDGFRVQGIHGADAYNWRKKEFGPAETATTGPDGKAYLKYPVMGIAEEKEYTRSLIFSVLHAEYCSTRIQDFPLDGTANPVRMTRGITIEISGYFGADRQPVLELVPILNEQGLRPQDWLKGQNGAFSFHKLSPGGHLIQLMGRLPSGEIVYSDTLAFTAESGKPCQLALPLKPGIRLEGRLDDQVPRPVRNARVMIDVRPKEYPALQIVEDFYAAEKIHGGREFWHSYRPIAEDGTFVFESIPPGEADIVVLGDGFATRSVGQLQNRVDGVLKPGAVMAIPQPCPLVAPVTQVEVATEPNATLDFTATTKSGAPIEGVWVGMYPSVFRMRGMYGWLKNSSEAPYREVPPLPDPVFSGQTDKNGRLVLRNMPAQAHGLEAYHSQFQVPLQDPNGWRNRLLRVTFSPGQTNQMKVVMEPKGTDFIGSAD